MEKKFFSKFIGRLLARPLAKARVYASGGGWERVFKQFRADKKTYKILRILTYLSKNLYNFTLYTVRQYYLNNGKYLPYKQAY